MQLCTLLLALFVVGARAGSNENTTHEYGRIVGGQPTSITKHPHQISLELYYWGSYKQHICGGSIIHRNWVLTAAHCVSGSPDDDLKIRAGTSERESGGVVHEIAQIIVHELYESIQDYDIALIKVEKPFKFSKTIRAIPMVDNPPRHNSAVVTTGWGHTSYNGDVSRHLMEVRIYIVDRKQCHKANKEIHAVTRRMLCAGVPEGGKDACQGDSGGPLVYNRKLAGVVSWGKDCALKGYPGVYANVANLRDWIFANSGI